MRYKSDWIIIEAPYDVVNYYKWWIERFIGKKISTSYHKPHITVLAGKYDKGLNKHPNWGKHDNEIVEFKYFSEIKTDNEWFFLGEYFWLTVDCPIISVLRTELGLSPYPFHKPHLTIGYCGY